VGECRSHDPAFLDVIVGAYRDAFRRAAASVHNVKGRKGKVRFRADHDYDPFTLDRNDDVVTHAWSAATGIGLQPSCKPVDGGLDANCFNRKGIPTITFGAGQHSPHTLAEYADLREFVAGCRLAVALATLAP
jgi:tripeptide aminopeptidase